ncbi:MAG: carboxypeptidase regulatory-like domain-containing protein [Deltaproteobacteria bacterium]|nr:carboxypeptidase regulatory-like domain-containing protein [Deltaproteobacteria bacterium]
MKVPSARRPWLGALSLLVGAACVVFALHRGTPREATVTPPVVAPSSGYAGRVLDTRLEPIAGAVVEAVLIGRDDAPVVLRSARTDASGTYRLGIEKPDDAAGVFLLRVVADGFGAAGRVVPKDVRQQDFTLSRAHVPVSVRVVGEDGRAVAGAEVVVSIEPRAAEPGALMVFGAKTDDDGEARFERVSAAASTLHWSAVARESGAAHGDQEKPAGDAPVTIVARLDGGGTIVGEVVTSDQRPVAAASIGVMQVAGAWTSSAVADGEGRFTVAHAPRSPLSLDVRGDFVLSGAADQLPVTLAPGEKEKRVRVVVEPAGVIRGRVVDAAGQGLPGVTVRAVPSTSTTSGPRVIESAADGTFALSALRLGTTWDLDARHATHAPAFAEKVDARGTVELRMFEGGVVSGRVVDDAGRAAVGVEIYAHRVEQRGKEIVGLRELATTRTAADGGYRIEHLGAGRYRVEIRPTERMAWSAAAAHVIAVDVAEGVETKLEAKAIPRTGEISARISGTTEATRSVEAMLLPRGRRGAPHRVRLQSGADGSFVLTGIEPGEYTLTTRHGSDGFVEWPPVTVTAGARRHVEANVGPRVRLAGIVTDGDGQPVAGAVVDAFAGGGAGGAGGAPRVEGRSPDDFTGNVTHTDARGRFELTGLVPRRLQVRVAKPGAPSASVDVDVPSDAPLSIVLPRPAGLVVTLSRAGKRAPDRVIWIDTADGAGHSASAVTGADGAARFEALPPGRYRVRAVADGVVERFVSIRAGEQRSEPLNDS